ncbi:MAG: hypothetical protein JSW28_03135, partial [Thermoplasmata archaeon]
MDEEIEEQREESEDELSRIVRDFETIKAIFNEPMNLLRDIQSSYGSRDYANTLEIGRRTLDMMEEPSKEFVKAGMAFCLSAALEWVLNLGEVGVDVSKAEALISQAREQF